MSYNFPDTIGNVNKSPWHFQLPSPWLSSSYANLALSNWKGKHVCDFLDFLILVWIWRWPCSPYDDSVALGATSDTVFDVPVNWVRLVKLLWCLVKPDNIGLMKVLFAKFMLDGNCVELGVIRHPCQAKTDMNTLWAWLVVFLWPSLMSLQLHRKWATFFFFAGTKGRIVLIVTQVRFNHIGAKIHPLRCYCILRSSFCSNFHDDLTS